MSEETNKIAEGHYTWTIPNYDNYKNYTNCFALDGLKITLDFAALSKITKERKVRIVRQEPRFYFENVEVSGKLFKFVIETKDGFSKCSSDFTLVKNGSLALQNKSRFMELHSGLHFKKGEEFTLKIKLIIKQASDEDVKALTEPKSCKYDFSSLYNDVETADFTFIVGRKEFLIHKSVLVEHSTLFAKIFDSKQRQNSKSEKLRSVNAETFTEVLRFIYTKEIQPQFLKNLMLAARVFKITSLMKGCTDKAIETLTIENALMMYELGREFDRIKLKSSAVALMSKPLRQLSDNLKNKNTISLDILGKLVVLAKEINVLLISEQQAKQSVKVLKPMENLHLDSHHNEEKPRPTNICDENSENEVQIDHGNEIKVESDVEEDECEEKKEVLHRFRDFMSKMELELD